MTTDSNQTSDILAMQIDHSSSTGTVILSNGYSETFPLDQPSTESNAVLSRSTFIPKFNILRIDPAVGQPIDLDLPVLRSPSETDGRFVVYIDQKDWSLLANSIHCPERIRDSGVKSAAEGLISLARAQKVILPIAMSHMTEASKWGNQSRRYHLALTMLELSGGWQIRHPLDVRRHELLAAISSSLDTSAPSPLEVITLQPGAALPKKHSGSLSTLTGDLPHEFAYQIRAIVALESFIAVLLDPESTPSGDILGWALENQEKTNWLASQPFSRSDRQRDAEAFFVHDVSHEIAELAIEAGYSSSKIQHWIQSDFKNDMRNCPSLGLFSEMYIDKHKNRQTKWKTNDLIDMMSLSCGAGYADYIVGEKSTISHLRQAAKRLGRSVKLYSSLSDLVSELNCEKPDPKCDSSQYA